MRNKSGFIVKLVYFIFFAFIATFILSKPHTVQAQEEKIRSYDVLFDIQKDGRIFVTEKIDYDFGANERHGIFRDIPYTKSGVDEKTQKEVSYAMKIDVRSVTDENGNEYKHIEKMQGENFNIRIGDANQTISGEHTYIITYTVSGGIEYFSDHDELFWNAIGTDWGVPVEKAHVRVDFQDIDPNIELQKRCLIGLYGSTDETECTITGLDFDITRPLQPSEGVTIVVGFPKGIVVELLPERIVPFFETILGKFVLIALGILFMFWYIVYPFWIIIKWYKQGRDPDVGPAVTAYFEGPKNNKGRILMPGETGALIDEVADLQDISATIVDLARRGYLRIEERDKNGIYFVRTEQDYKGDKNVRNYERTLLDKIFLSENEVKVKDIKLYSTIQDIYEMIYNGLVDDGFFPSNPEVIRGFYTIIAVLSLISMNFFLLVIAIIFGRNMPRKTEFGAREAKKAQGLLNFLKSQSTRLEFEAKEYFHLKDVQTLFEKLLPFAIAFGVEKVWMERFKSIDLKEPDWYSSYRSGSFNSVLFADSLRSSMNSIQAASIPPRSSTGGSSGFSSGGFSGGGGGGGGGGSW